MADGDYVRLRALTCGCGSAFTMPQGPGRNRLRCDPCVAAKKEPKRPPKRQPEPRRCRCGAALAKKLRTCSACQQERLKKNAARRRATEVRACDHCGRGYVPLRERGRFCSSTCKFELLRRRAFGPQYRPRPAKPEQPTVCEYSAGMCAGCGQAFGRRSMTEVCSDRCKNWAAHKAAAKVVACEECSSIFCPVFGARGSNHVCTPCAALRKRAARKAAKVWRNAKKRGAEGGERFSPLTVLARDKWRCQLCGKKTPQFKRGTLDHNAPELDHIVPLSLGGQHTMSNTQCACRACNLAKGARALGQLHLALA